mgnify:CR=1 FL=1
MRKYCNSQHRIEIQIKQSKNKNDKHSHYHDPFQLCFLHADSSINTETRSHPEYLNLSFQLLWNRLTEDIHPPMVMR